MRANERIRRSLARFPEMAWRSQITELVFGVAELEQDRRTVAGVGWFRECPAQLLRRGVWGTAANADRAASRNMATTLRSPLGGVAIR